MTGQNIRVLGMAIALVAVPTAGRAQAHSPRGMLTCRVSPGSDGYFHTDICKSTLPGFTFDGYFERQPLGPGYPQPTSYQWSITTISGSAPSIVDGCGSTDAFCDLLLSTTSSANTVVKVRLSIDGGATWMETRAIVPCTTVKQDNHPTLCS